MQRWIEARVQFCGICIEMKAYIMLCNEIGKKDGIYCDKKWSSNRSQWYPHASKAKRMTFDH